MLDMGSFELLRCSAVSSWSCLAQFCRGDVVLSVVEVKYHVVKYGLRAVKLSLGKKVPQVSKLVILVMYDHNY